MLAGFCSHPYSWMSISRATPLYFAGYLGLCSFRIAVLRERPARRNKLRARLRTSGFAVLYGGEALGIFLANGLDATNSLNTTPYAAMATAGLAMVCAYVFLFTERDFSALSRVVDAAVDNTEDVKKAIAQAAALSARETEVLSPALRGRTNERIAQELFIAKKHRRHAPSPHLLKMRRAQPPRVARLGRKNRRQPAIARIGAAHGNTRKK